MCKDVAGMNMFCQGPLTPHSVTSVFHGQGIMVSENTELNICIKFYEMTGKTATDTVQIAL
jgi:hypothetical protein